MLSESCKVFWEKKIEELTLKALTITNKEDFYQLEACAVSVRETRSMLENTSQHYRLEQLFNLLEERKR